MHGPTPIKANSNSILREMELAGYGEHNLADFNKFSEDVKESIFRHHCKNLIITEQDVKSMVVNTLTINGPPLITTRMSRVYFCIVRSIDRYYYYY